MILNTGSRTDIVQYYTEWLLKRFEDGFVYSRNPLFKNKVTRYELNPKVVDCILFCSKNYEPILPHIQSVMNKFNTYFYYTITAYGKDIEPNVPDIDKSIETLIKLAKITGKNRISWRYDPILLTNTYTKENHYAIFEYIAKRVFPYVDRCIFSFVELYKKLKINMPELILLTNEDKNEILEHIGTISKKYNLYTQTCAIQEDYLKYNIHQSGCITADILGKANNITFKNLRHRGIRINCKCLESRNIGDYDTCPNGCRYCYANQNSIIAAENFKRHNPNSPLILGDLSETDEITVSTQKSFLISHEQKKLF